MRRLAFVGRRAQRAFVQVAGEAARVPLGTMGEGFTRLLSLALAVADLAGKPGVGGGGARALLVDEIDAGLHHTVLEKMWTMLLEAARRHGVQVFATTHSSDCVSALAGALVALGRPEDAALYRLRPDKRRAARFGADELLRVRDEGLELR